MSDKEKILRFNEILNEYRDMLFRLCTGYLYNKTDIHDLYQEISINIWKNLEQFRGEAKISTWVYRIAVNTAISFNKKEQKRVHMIHNLERIESTDQEENESGTNKLNALRKAIGNLKEQDRIIITLVLEGLSYAEIADVIGLNPSNVGVRIKRVKERLYNLMQASNHE